MYDYDYIEENMASVAQTCKYLKSGSILKQGGKPDGTVSCNICRNWDGSKCSMSAFDNVARKLETD